MLRSIQNALEVHSELHETCTDCVLVVRSDDSMALSRTKSHQGQDWLPVFAGMTIGPHSYRAGEATAEPRIQLRPPRQHGGPAGASPRQLNPAAIEASEGLTA